MKSVMSAGIDPGKSGGIVLLDRNGEILDKIVMPDTSTFAEYIQTWKPHYTFLEKAQSMPSQGVASVFNYADHFGQLQGVLIALKMRFTLVPPRTWQKVCFAGTSAGYQPKQRAAIACKRLFPKDSMLATQRCQKPHEGLVDATLIALYGLKSLTELSLSA